MTNFLLCLILHCVQNRSISAGVLSLRKASADLDSIDVHILKQQSSITGYRLPSKVNKLPISISICSKKRKFAVFNFGFQQTNGSCRFPVVLFSFTEFRKHRDMDMEIWTWRHGIFKNLTENRSSGDSPSSIYRWLSLSTGWRRNKRKLSICKRTKQTKRRTCPSMLISKNNS